MDCQSPTPTSQNSPILVNRSADYELWISIFQAIDELISWKKSEFSVLVLGFEKLGLGLDNCGRTIKNAYCPIYSLREEVRDATDYRCESLLSPYRISECTNFETMKK